MWQPIDIHSFTEWDPTLVEQLEAYLAEKETALAQDITEIIYKIRKDEQKDQGSSFEEEIKLSTAIERVAKAIRLLVNHSSFEPLSIDEWRLEIRKLNQSVWEYIEVLEGAVIELFHHVSLIGVEKWNASLFEGATSIKEILIRRIDDITWAVRRLENHLKEYRSISEQRIGKEYFWKKWLIWWQPVLDPALLINLSKSEKFCKKSYADFVEHFEGFKTIQGETDVFGKKFSHFHVLNEGKEMDAELLTRFCKTLYLWERNEKAKAFPQKYAIQAVKRMIRPDPLYHLFQRYDQALRRSIFACSRALKKLSSSQKEKERKKMQEQLIVYRKEVRTLMNTVAKYRDFLLRTDPDPYVRSRWGFTEWIVGPEPSLTRRFLNLAYGTKELRERLDDFIKALSQPSPSFAALSSSELYQNIEYTLHEMAQPLNTEEMMQRRSETLLLYLAECHEIDSTDWKVVKYVEDVLGRALRADWKYHVLQEQTLFSQIYGVHEGILSLNRAEEDREQENKIVEQIEKMEEIFRKGESLFLGEELEGIVQAIRQELQYFLQKAQQCPKKDLHQKELVRHQLLCYRVHFGKFLRKTQNKLLDGQPVRTAFFFIDQYLEAAQKALD